MAYTTTGRHISTIKAGDTILYKGIITTVGNSDIREGFMGRTIFGDGYNMGTLPVLKVADLRGNDE